jgi:cation-transporting ATPase E
MYEGLSSKEVENKKRQGHVNGETKRLSRSYKQIVKGNVFTYFNFVNIVLFFLVCFTGQMNNALFIFTMLANTCIGIFQEIKAKQLLDKLAIIVVSKVEAKRDGEWKDIPVSEIVLDDLIRLDGGDQVPVDGDLVDGYLEVNESMLTGESNIVIKQKDNHVYAGTVITSGQGYAHVTRVGKDCLASTIMADAQKEKKAESKLHNDLNKLIRVISYALIPIGIVLYIVQKNNLGMNWSASILKTVAAVVGMIPEGLVVLTSIALAVSVIRLSQKKVLVQDLFSIESLARVDTICLDKTGTLTQGAMKVTSVRPLFDADEAHIKDVMGSYFYHMQKPNATSKAMIEYFGTNEHYPITDVLPFSSDRKYAGAALTGEGTFYVGAVNFLFPKGSPIVNKYLSEHTEAGERVVVIAHSSEALSDVLPEDLEPLAIVAIRDVLRDHVEEIMKYFQKQDVDIRVISGDDPSTVSSLARQAGIPYADAFVDMSSTNESVEYCAANYTVFGRVLPDQKKALVKALQKQGRTVAMTGDGVNDVPALKSADVSVAMAAGASAAKDSANIVLLDNDFGKMPSIVDEGRRVINNISRASSMYLVKTIFSMLLSIYVILLVREYPFLPVHLSVISAFGVGVPTFFLQLESSFEKVSGRFFSNALRNSLPSATAVFLTAILCMLIRDGFYLPDARFYGIFVSVTCFIYLYTLYRVYYPPTRLRWAVFIAMGVCMMILFLFAQRLINVSYEWIDLTVIIPMMVLEPFLISLLARILDAIADFFGRIYDFFHGKFHHD